MKKFLVPIPIIIAILICGASAYAAVRILGAANRGLVFDWKIDEGAGTTLADNSENGNTATLYGSTDPSWVDPGRFGSAISFDGDDQYAESDSPIASLGTSDQAYSISTWVKIDPSETSGNIIHLSNNQNGVGWCIPFITYNNEKFSAISYNSGAQYATQPDTTSLDAWHHVVTTWSSADGLRLYVDGVLKETTPQGNFTAADMPIYVHLARGNNGCTADTGMFKGSIDDTRVYSKELSQTQISALYSSNTDSIVTISGRTSGLAGDFYAGDNFDTLVSSAVDTTINFDPSDDVIGVARAGTGEHYTARWTGYVTPEFSEDYTFYTSSDDGVRLYVDNNLVIDSWILQGTTEHSSAPITLTAGHAYSIVLEFWENEGGSAITLSWESLSTPKDIISGSALSHSGGTTTINDSRNTRVTDGLVGLWSFDGPDMVWGDATTGTAYDRSGNEYNGTITGMTQTGSPTPGRIGQALRFVGADSSYVQTGYTIPYQDDSTLFSWSAWVKSDQGNPDHATILGYRNGDKWIKLTMTSFEYGDSPLINYAIPSGKWTHIAIVKAGPDFFYFVNGALVGNSSYPFSVDSHTFYIGGDPAFPSDGFYSGLIDDVRAYDTVLSEAQVKQLYLMGK